MTLDTHRRALPALRAAAFGGLLGAACAGLLGCREAPRPDAPAAGPAAGAQDGAAAGAPSEADVARAVARLAEWPEPVPLPPSRVDTRDPSVVRFAERLDDAELSSAWSAPSRDPFVASVGPVSTERPGPNALLRDSVIRRVDFQALELRGFRFDAASVGQIVIRTRVTGSPFFILRWPGAPGMQIDVGRGEEAIEYALSTDRLAKWEGEIDRMSLLVPVERDRPQPRIELELLGFVRRGSAYTRAAGTERVRIGRVVRESIFLHGTSRLVFPAEGLGAGARLAFGASVLGEPLRLEVSIEGGGRTEPLVDEEISDGEVWRDFRVDLPPGEGERRLVFAVEGPAESVLFLAEPTAYMPRPAPPTVILYLIDTLGALHTSLDGYERQTTPELERLAVAGTLFRNAFSNAAYTPESVPSLMTSLHTRSHGLTEMFERLAPDFLTLQEAFQAAGWATAAFSTNANAGPERATDLGFGSFYDHLAFGGYEPGLRTAPIDQIVGWLEAHRDRPAFVYIHTAEPHSPYEPPPPFKHLFDPGYHAGLGRLELPQALAMPGKSPYTPRELKHLVALYDGEIAFADYVVGSLHRVLDRRGLLDNATLAVTADHGEEFLEHGRLGHGGGVTSQLVKVPLVLWGAGAPTGLVVEENVQLLDLMPTLLELAGISVTAPLQGDSLAPLLAGETDGFADRPIVTATYLPQRPRFALIEGRWKLNVQVPGAYSTRLELYDLAADPREQRDLANDRPDLVGQMLRELARLVGDLPAYRGQEAERHQISQEQIERLRALGYLE